MQAIRLNQSNKHWDTLLRMPRAGLIGRLHNFFCSVGAQCL